MVIDLYEDQPVAWQHQVDEIPSLLRGSYALFWEQRLGKTRECGEALRILDAERAIDGVLILCPVNAKHVWGHAFDTFLPNWPVYVCDGLAGQPIPPESKAVILNPNILEPQNRLGARFSGWRTYLLDWFKVRRVVMIEDESHLFFTNPVSITYKAGMSLARVADRVWTLTGTPLEKSGLDIHWLLRHLGGRYPYMLANRDQFGKRYCESEYNWARGHRITTKKRGGGTWEKPTGGYEYGLLKDPEDFWRDMLGIADRRMRIDCIDVPMSRRMDVWVDDVHQPYDPGQWENQRQTLIQLKVDHTISYVRRLLEEGQGPVVVGGAHRLFTEAVATRLHAPLVRGGVSADTRARIYTEFQHGKHDVLVGNIRAMGVAAELSRSHHLVVGEIDWVARNLRQLEDRLTGANQKSEILIHYLMIRHSVDEHVWDRALLKGRGMDDLDEAARRIRQIEANGAIFAEMDEAG